LGNPASEMSNERIRQALTSEFAHSELDLTIHQAFTADQMGEMEFLDFNY